MLGLAGTPSIRRDYSLRVMPDVLLVTDATWVRTDVEAAIGGSPGSITVVSDPTAAVSAASQSSCELIVVDMQVASMGGMAIVRQLKAAMAGGEIDQAPVLLMLDREADSFLARRSGADAHLLKPFTAQDFRAAAENLTSS